MFVGRAGTYPIEAAIIGLALALLENVTVGWKGLRLARNKHSSLWGTLISCEEKKRSVNKALGDVFATINILYNL
jgi:hypothetical protein